MKCEESQALIEEYFDGELDPQTSGQVSIHIENCLSCSEELQQLAREFQIYQTYQRGVEATPALWTRVRSSISEEHPVHHPGLVERWRESWRMVIGNLMSPRFSVPVSAVLVFSAIVGTVAVMKFVNKQQPSTQIASSPETPTVEKQNAGETGRVDESKTSGEVEVPLKASEKKRPNMESPRNVTAASVKPTAARENPAVARTPAQLVRAAEKNYISAIAMLTRDVAQRPSQLDPETRAKLDGALASIDRTIAATRRAVQKNPNDPMAVQYMLTAYAKKVDVLKEMTNY